MTALRLSDRETPTERVFPLALVGALSLTALFELLVLRTFTRTAIHIPAIEAMARPYEWIALSGRFAYYLSAVLLLAALPWLGARCWQSGERVLMVAAACAAGFLLVGAAAVAGVAGNLPVDTVTIVAVVLLAGVAAGTDVRRAGPTLGLFAAGFALSGTHTILQAVAETGGGAIDSRWLLTAGEYAGVGFAVAAPFLVGRRLDRKTQILAVVVGLVTFAAFLGNGGATARILLLWNEGLSGTLPSVLYATAAGALVASAVGLIRSGRPAGAIALGLLVAGGFGLHNTYQSGLVVAGMLVFALMPARERDKA